MNAILVTGLFCSFLLLCSASPISPYVNYEDDRPHRVKRWGGFGGFGYPGFGGFGFPGFGSSYGNSYGLYSSYSLGGFNNGYSSFFG